MQQSLYVRSGLVTLSIGYARDVGGSSIFWSSIVNSPTTGYNSHLNVFNVSASHVNNRYAGFSARCLASGA